MMWVSLLFSVTFVFLLIVLKILRDEHKKYKAAKKLNEKCEEVLRVFSYWRYREETGGKIARRLRDRHEKIAIYGLGRIGRALIDEFLNEDISIAYLVDQGYEEASYRGIPCFHADTALPKADILIITVPSSACDIKEQLKNVTGDVTFVKSVWEVLYAI